MDPNDDNGDAIIIKRIERNLKVFRGIAYFAIAVILLLFLTMGISWMSNREHYENGGAGTVIAMFYIAPILLMDIIIVIYFGIISTTVKKRMIDTNYEFIKQQYRQCSIVFGIVMILSFCSIAVLF